MDDRLAGTSASSSRATLGSGVGMRTADCIVVAIAVMICHKCVSGRSAGQHNGKAVGVLILCKGKCHKVAGKNGESWWRCTATVDWFADSPQSLQFEHPTLIIYHQ